VQQGIEQRLAASAGAHGIVVSRNASANPTTSPTRPAATANLFDRFSKGSFIGGLILTTFRRLWELKKLNSNFACRIICER
jgi:hypothetical protein